METLEGIGLTSACFLGWVTTTLYQQYAQIWNDKDDNEDAAGDSKTNHVSKSVELELTSQVYALCSECAYASC